MFTGFPQDLRYACRTLAKSPGFVATTVVSLALGIGINTAIYSVIHTAMDRPVSGREPAQLVDLSLSTSAGNALFGYSEYLELRDRTRSFSGVMALMHAQVRITGQGRPELASVLMASPNFFGAFRQDLAMGRGFQEGGAADEVVLGEAFWKRRFAGDPAIIGKTVALAAGASRYTCRIAGVLPRSFRYSSVWTPDMVMVFPDDLRKAPGRGLTLMARVKSGVSMAQAKAETEAVVARMAELFPADLAGARVNFWPKVRRDATTRTVAAIVQTVFGLVLLIGCINVMNLLLVRHQQRRFEMATRLALGASGGRLIRQLLLESLLLAVPSGLAGYGLAVATLRVVETIRIPGLEGAQLFFYLDGQVLCFALAAGVAASVVAGLWPARAAAKLDLISSLKGGGASVGRRKFGVRGVLVAAQVALSTVGITAAAMLTQGVLKLTPFDPGVDPHKVLAASVWPAMSGYSEARSAEFRRALGARLEREPGVQAVAFAALVPGADFRTVRVSHPGSAAIPKSETVAVQSNSVGPGFFRAFGIAMRRGREPDDAIEAGRRVCVVNETLARRFWPGGEPLGRFVRVSGPKPVEYEVAAVARDTEYERTGNDHAAVLYLPLAPTETLTVFLRTAGAAAAWAEPVRRAVAALDAEMPVNSTAALVDRLTGGSTGTELRLRAGVMGTLGGTALLLSSLGIYGIVSYLVSRRTREIGIRLALGAGRGDVLRAVLADGVRLVAIGMGAGVALSLVVCPLLASQLYGLAPHHPGVIVASCAILGAVAAAAMLAPARRVSRVQAAAMLRYE